MIPHPDVAEARLKIAAARWGQHPMNWPMPPRRRPRWWELLRQFEMMDLEETFGDLSDQALARYWFQSDLGQSVFEDAGGYLMRCYSAMLGLPVDEPTTYRDMGVF